MNFEIIPKNEIMEETFSEATYQKGENLFRGNRVGSLKLTHQENSVMIKTIVKGSKSYEVACINDQIHHSLSYECTCPAFEKYMGACKHIVATMLQYNELVENNPQETQKLTEASSESQVSVPKNEEYRGARYLLNKMSDYLDSHTGYTGRKKVNFEYQFSFEALENEEESSLRIKVGTEKLYQVKDIEQNARYFLEEKSIAFGKNFDYDPAEHYIAAKDREMLHLLLELKDYRFQSYYYYSYRSGNKSEMEIPAIFVKSMLLKVLQMEYYKVKLRHRADGTNNQNFENPIIHMEGEAVLPIPLQLTQDSGSEGDDYHFSIKDANEHTFLLYPSQKILIKENEFYYLTDEEILMLEAVLTAFAENDEKELKIPRKMIRDYMTQTIPSLQQKFPVEITEEIQEQFQKRPLLAKMLLDWQDDALYMDIEFHYGDQFYRPMASQVDKQELPDTLLLDVEKEGKILNAIYDFEFDFEMEDSSIVLSQPDEIYRFLFEAIPVLKEWMEVYTSSNVEHMLYSPAWEPKLVVDLDKKSNLLQITFDMEGIEEEDLQGIMHDLMAKRKYRKLTNGKLVNLQDRAFQEYKGTLEQMDIAVKDVKREMNVPLHKVFSLNEETMERAELKNPIREFLMQLDSVEETHYPLPEKLQANLRPYQVEGFQWLKTLDKYGFGGILADDMGLGKTVQALTFIASSLEEQTKPILVVCPSSVLYNWQKESTQFIPGVESILIAGTKTEREESVAKALEENIPLWITSYPVLIRDMELYEEVHFKSIFFDEAQIVKNNTAKTTKAARLLHAQNKFALSGTPLENQLGEIYSIYSIVVPGLFGTQKAFKQMDMEQIIRKIRPFLLRRLKKEVLTELPDKVESVEYISLSDEQRNLYLSQWKLVKNETAELVEKGTLNENRIKVLAGLTRLRQICCDPRLVNSDYKGNSAKLERLLEYLKTARENGKRVVLFSQFTQMLALIQNELKKEGRDYFYLDGSTPNLERLELTSRFNEGEKDLFLISLRAGGTGLNLTGGDTVILYDSWWNPAVESQATDRVHRYGQKKMVQVIRMICTGTIEERINELQEQKRELIDQVITDGKQSITSLTKEELMDILSD
ncbi:DEAD/DEAH box helicase [Jeotgalibaca sp. MA1X17-3]|uniref:DEAD/DEAH box helicase n=1 Tax=Jeotgalibaca sp. MA1X17-3 TaxID=2908211 RepID=UPI001F42AE88|nr:DEAD/DEAH box helicase [Jeotgalibaca sp. MA1X17-3]UJF16350.1 DEAD/DEAH box helicase [Jeotgalibaca sp. MA1X17-3]